MRLDGTTRWLTSHARARRTALGVTACLLAGGSVAAVASSDGFPLQQLAQGSGDVWVASASVGQLALLDGSTATLAVQVPVAAPVQDLVAAQGERDGYAVNRTLGAVTRVDGGTWEPGTPTALVPGAGPGLTVVSGHGVLYAVDGTQGLVVEADPESLALRGPARSLSADPAGVPPVLDDEGTLWLLDATRGDLLRVRDAVDVAAREVTDAGSGRLLVAGGSPVVVDQRAGTAVRYDGDGRPDATACVDVRPTDTTVHLAGSATRARVYAISGDDGVLRVSDLATGRCDRVVPGVAAPGSVLGTPVEVDDRLFVPDHSTGRVVLVDLRTLAVVATTVPVVDAGNPFELLAHDGFVFYNDAATEKAGVIRDGGAAEPIAKYDVDDPAGGIAVAPQPAPGASAPAAPQPSAPPPGSSPTASPPVPDAGTTPGTTPAPDGAPRPRRTAAPLPEVVPPATPPPATPAPETPAPSPTAPPSEAPPAVATLTVGRAGGPGVLLAAVPGQAPQACAPTCVVDQIVGTPVELSTERGPAERVADWGVPGCAASDATCTVTVGDVVGVVVTFAGVAQLTVRVEGPGSVTVVPGPPEGADPFEVCVGGTCTWDYPAGTAVELTAQTTETFTGWGGVCSGTGGCAVTLAGAREVLAGFRAVDRTPPDVVTVSGGGESLGLGGGSRRVDLVGTTTLPVSASASDAQSTVTRTEIWVDMSGSCVQGDIGQTTGGGLLGSPTAAADGATVAHTVDFGTLGCGEGFVLVSASASVWARAASEGGRSGNTGRLTITWRP